MLMCLKKSTPAFGMWFILRLSYISTVIVLVMVTGTWMCSPTRSVVLIQQKIGLPLALVINVAMVFPSPQTVPRSAVQVSLK